MDKYLIFENPGQISVLDLISMGDSEKRFDSSKIGKFDSGLKYALAILYRNGIKFWIETTNKKFNVETTILKDNNKTKEVLQIKELTYLAEGTKEDIYVTGFSPKLGYDWKFWMAFREIFSNCLDENGHYYTVNNLYPLESNSTRFVIVIDEKVQEVLNYWNDYFLKEELIEEYNNIQIHKNTSEHLKVYKQGILVFEDLNRKAKWSYNHKSIKIDEMRCARLDSNFESDLRHAIIYSENKDIINTFCYGLDTYESNLDYDYSNSFSNIWVDLVNKYFEDKTLKLPSQLLKAISKDERFKVGIKRIPVPNAVYSWDRVTVKETPEEYKTETFEETIKQIARKNNFDVKYPIIESKIKSYVVLGDSRAKVLYITKDFSDADMWKLIQAHFNIDSNGDADYVYKEYVKLLNKNV